MTTQTEKHQTAQPDSPVETGYDWGTNAQLIITAKQAETLAQLHLWSEFVKRMEQKIFLQNEENHQAPL